MSPKVLVMTKHSNELRAVAAYGLAGSLTEMPTQPLSGDAFDRLHARVRQQKLTGLFWAAISDGAFPVTGDQREAAEGTHLHALTGVVQLESLLLETVETLDRAGIPVRALKGTALAHLDYPVPEQRTFGDIDLLVPSGSFDDAVATLTSLGCERRCAEPRPGFDRRFAKGTCLRTRNGLEIDLHRSFSMGPFGELLALAELWAESDFYEVEGTRVDALAVEARLLHAAYHATLGNRPPLLVPLRDVAQILLTQDVSWARLQQMMTASTGEPVVATAVATAWRELAIADVLAVSSWAAGYQASPRAAGDMAVYGLNSSYAATSVRTLRAIPSVNDRVRFLLALGMPESSYFENRHDSRLDRFRRGLSDIRRPRETL